VTANGTTPALCSHCLLPIRGPGHERQVQGEDHGFCCYGCCLAFQVARGEGEESEAAWLLIRLGTGAFLSMNIMLFSLLLYSGTFESSDGDVRPVVHLLLWVLATPCMLILGGPLFQETWYAAVQRRLTSATLISLGAGTAYAYSTLAVVTGASEVYFDTATMLLVLYTIGRYLEAAGRARAMRSLAPMLAIDRELVTVLDGGAEARRPVREVTAGTLVLVRPGERLGVDGIVVEGFSHVDEAVITGESQLVAKTPGAEALAGSINHEGALVIRSTGAGTATRWAGIARSVREALAQPSHAQRLADRIAGALVPAVLVLAGLTVLIWAQWAPLEQALLTGLAVLVVACPCGLGLAGALATSLGIGRLARRRCLVRGGQILEALAGVRVVAFDKTGTLTVGATCVTAIETDGTPADEVLRLAAGLERSSEHPLAHAIVAAAAARGLRPALTAQARAVPGCGIQGRVEGRRVAAGSGAWLAELGWPVPVDLARSAGGLEAPGAGLIHIGWAGRVRGVLALGEALRPEAPAAVAALRRLGLQTVLLTGDRAAAAARIAAGLGLDGCEADLSPEGKRAALRRWRERRGGVAMVGDGLNDGPVLAAADVGIAVGSATDLARETAGIVLPEGGLLLLPWVIGLSWAVRRTILTNLLWAFGYNSIGLALAVSGHLQPVMAAVLMAGSSLLVVLNSLRLERFAAPSDHPRPEDAPAAEPRVLDQAARPRAPAPRPATSPSDRLAPRGSAANHTPETTSSSADQMFHHRPPAGSSRRTRPCGQSQSPPG
jgi:Cu2+-exporting ATPase